MQSGCVRLLLSLLTHPDKLLSCSSSLQRNAEGTDTSRCNLHRIAPSSITHYTSASPLHCLTLQRSLSPLLTQLPVPQSRHRVPCRWTVLWAVHALGMRYRALARRQELRRKAYEAGLDKAGESERRAIEECLADLDEISSSEVCG